METPLGQSQIRPYIFARGSRWPDATYEPIPHRGKWATLTKSPVPWISIRGRGESVSQRLMVGTPFQLDPDTDYEVNSIGFETDAIFTYANKVRTDRDRAIQIVIDEYPRAGGVCRFAALWTSSATDNVGLPCVRLTVEGSDVVSVRYRGGGVDAIQVYVDPHETDDPGVNIEPRCTVGLVATNGVYMSYGLGMNLIGNSIQPGVPQYIELLFTHANTGGALCQVVVNQKVMRGWR